jgi:DNA-binding NarL/FixJ family response regulator
VSADTITVVLADDQRVVREGLAMVLGLMPGVEVIGTACNGEEAIALVDQLGPDVVLMDLRMPRCDGVEATRRLRQSGAEAKVVVLTTYADDHSVIQALRAGACGFLTKDATNDEIRNALEAATRGESAIDPAVQHHLVVSETTVKSHVNHLYAKIGARDRAQAVAYAYRSGIAPGAS